MKNKKEAEPTKMKRRGNEVPVKKEATEGKRERMQKYIAKKKI